MEFYSSIGGPRNKQTLPKIADVSPKVLRIEHPDIFGRGLRGFIRITAGLDGLWLKTTGAPEMKLAPGPQSVHDQLGPRHRPRAAFDGLNGNV